MRHLPSFLALTAADQPMLVYMVILGFIALGPALHSWIKVWQWIKGETPDMAKYVTQEQLASVKTERDSQIAATLSAIRTDMAELKKDVKDDLKAFEEKSDALQKDITSLHHCLGLVEGELNAEAKAKPARRRGR